MKIELFISDLDGTIVETEDYHRQAYNVLFKELGIQKSWNKHDYMQRLQTLGGNKFHEIFKWMDLPQEEYEETKSKLYQRKTELYAQLITEDLVSGVLCLRPGIKRLFSELADAEIPLAIATACVGWAAKEVLIAALGDLFVQSLACLSGGESTKKHKPSPDIYLLTAEKCGVDPGACVVLEDTSHGMNAAKDAGMRCLVTPSEFSVNHDFSRADLVLQDLETPQALRYSDLRTL
jgi:beta-phosphoglucomutase-like phosphatase (HAD superfamily)